VTVVAGSVTPTKRSSGLISPRRSILLAWMLWTFIGAGMGEKYLNLPLPILWVGLYGPIVLLFMIWILDSFVEPNVRIGRFPLLALALFAIYVCLSAFLSGISLFGLAIRMRDYFKYIALFFPMAALFAKETTARHFFRLAIWLLVIQTPLVVYQFVFESGMSPDDTNGGTLGVWGTGQLMMLVAYTTCVAVSLWMRGYHRWRCVALLAWLAPIMPLAGAYVGVFFIPFAALAGAIGVGLWRWLSRMVVLALLTAMLIGGFVTAGGVNWILNRTGDFGRGLSFGLYAVTAEVADSLGSPGRLYELSQVWQHARRSGQLWFGKGAGSAVGSLNSRIASRQAGGSATILGSSISNALYELGLVGVGLYLLIIAAMGYEVYRRRRTFQGPFWRALYGAYFGCLAVHVGSAFYQTMWGNTWASFAIWFLGALLLGHGGSISRVETSCKETPACVSLSLS